MADTLDQVPGKWTLWVRTGADPTATYGATFVASAPGASGGQVTVTSGQTTYAGTWTETDVPVPENVSFQIEDPAGSGQTLYFSGFMVGLAMGGA